ncbi:disulfide bond formation protein DsbA [Campylobacter sp. 9BO]|uniref:Ppx/GppA phosphatase family protein n=1 Tax=Campylobacter sp. 9BO TaxID=3424759 RepID=UPI003D341D35
MFLSIDLGSNTVRFLLVNENLRQIKVYENIIGAAHSLNKTGKISDQAIDTLYKTLEKADNLFNFKAQKHQGVATGAWRVAKNAKDILDDIKEKFGLNFCIIEGKSEANLTFLGVKNALKREGLDLKKCAFIDLGGASTEIGNKDRHKSFNFGIITFYENFKILDKMQEAAKTTCMEAKFFLHSLNARHIILTSGVPTTMAAYKIGQTYYNYDASKINKTRLSLDDIKSLTAEFLYIPAQKADEIFGKNRQMLLVAGGVLLAEILKECDAQLIVIDDGLREGIAAAYKDGNLSKFLIK